MGKNLKKHRPLTPKHKQFVLEYMKDFNATAAAIRAGYSPKTANRIGSRLLTYVDVQVALQESLKAQEERTQIDADYILTNIKAMFERCSQAVPVLDKSGKPIPGEWRFDSFGALKALELLGKNKKLFTDKVELEGQGFAALVNMNREKDVPKPPEDLTR